MDAGLDDLGVVIYNKHDGAVVKTCKGITTLNEHAQPGTIIELSTGKRQPFETMLKNAGFYQKPDDLEKMVVVVRLLTLFPNVIIRYHGDADGISSALQLKRLLNRAVFIQQNSAIYQPHEAIDDISALMPFETKHVLFVDCCSNEESNEPMRLLKENGVFCYSIDHHKPAETTLKNQICSLNPLKTQKTYGHPASRLVFDVMKNINEELANRFLCDVGYAGDRIDTSNADARRVALALDFITFYKRYPRSLDLYEEVCGNMDTALTFYIQAKEAIDSAITESKKYVKIKEKPHITIIKLNLDKLTEKKKFPNRAKVATALIEQYYEKHKKPCVLIGHGKGRIILRARGCGVLTAIENVKQAYDSYVKSGGGHEVAASLSIKEGFEQTIANAIESILSGEDDGRLG